MCGKNSDVQARIIYLAGSPPRVREKPMFDAVGMGIIRITPACAGKTPTSVRPLQPPWDHPRVCGKNVGTI